MAPEAEQHGGKAALLPVEVGCRGLKDVLGLWWTQPGGECLSPETLKRRFPDTHCWSLTFAEIHRCFRTQPLWKHIDHVMFEMLSYAGLSHQSTDAVSDPRQ